MDLYNDDCILVLDDLINKGVKVDCILTDPPYCSGATRGSTGGKGLGKYYDGKTLNCVPFSSDDLSSHAFLINTKLWVNKCSKLLNDGGYFFCFTDYRQLANFSDAIEQSGIIQRGLIVWDKKNSRPQKGCFTQSTEFVIWGIKGKRKTDKILKGLYTEHSIHSNKKLHPSEKPNGLLKHLLSILPDNSTVLDPFMGSGATGKACEELGHDFIGVEMDDYYFDVAYNRLKQCTNECI